MRSRRLTAIAAATVLAVFLPASTQATPAQSTATPAWTGVSEVVVIDVDAGGVVSGSPSQKTEVTAASSSTVHVGVPMSPAGLRRIGPGSPPPVVDNVAQFSFDRSGTQTQTVSSDFVQPLPVTVTPTYQLDGQSTTPEELTRSLSDRQRQSGVLTVTYDIANVTNQTTTVSYADAAGTNRTEVVTQAVPIAGALKLTLPKNASGIDAPGATLTPGASGVGVSWTLLLAPPLAPARQSISYSMNVANAQIPRSRLSLAVIVPEHPPTGDAPAAVGAAVSTSQAAAQARLAQAQTQAQTSLEQVQADLAALEQAQLGGRTRENRVTAALSNDRARASDGELSDLSQTISTTATNAREETEAAVAQIRDQLDGLQAAIADHSDRLAGHSDKVDLLKDAVKALAARVGGVAAQTAQHVTAATDLRSLVSGAIATLDHFPDHGTPDWVQLAADLAATHAKADVVVSAATDLQTEAAQVGAATQQLSTDIDTMSDGAHELVATGGGIRDHLTLIIAAAQSELAARLQTAASQVAALGAEADAARSNLARQDRDGRARADATRRRTTAQLAAEAQTTTASLHDAVASAQSKVAEASATYVQLLALAQLGLANQLPAGNAVGATAQTGSYVFTISGTR